MSIISGEHMSIPLEVNFSTKHQLLYYDYHSNGFYLISYASNKLDNHFAALHKLFLSFHRFYFLISENQSAAGNVIQLNKKNKPNNDRVKMRLGRMHRN